MKVAHLSAMCTVHNSVDVFMCVFSLTARSVLVAKSRPIHSASSNPSYDLLIVRERTGIHLRAVNRRIQCHAQTIPHEMDMKSRMKWVSFSVLCNELQFGCEVNENKSALPN